jgi:LacI family transcriptional regulator
VPASCLTFNTRGAEKHCFSGLQRELKSIIMKKKISIGDIAKALNVSKTAVSFVLNGKAKENYISEALEERVLKYVEEVGYKPNQLAQGLRTGKTKLIGMLVEDISDPFFSSIARVIEESAFQKGYKVFFSSTENNTAKAKDLLDVYRSRQVDGYIIAPAPGLEAEIQALLNDQLPVVLFDRYFPEIPTDNVLVNNFESTHKAVSYLVENGYQHIAFLTLQSEQIQMAERRRGYLTAIEARQEPLMKVFPYHQEPVQTVTEIRDYLVDHPEADAVFFATNYLAESGLEAVQLLNKRIPEDLGIIVFDDRNLFRLYSPPITAIAQPIRELSEQVINRLLDYLTGRRKNDGKTITTIVPAELIIRKSCVPKAVPAPVLAPSRTKR